MPLAHSHCFRQRESVDNKTLAPPVNLPFRLCQRTQTDPLKQPNLSLINPLEGIFPIFLLAIILSDNQTCDVRMVYRWMQVIVSTDGMSFDVVWCHHRQELHVDNHSIHQPTTSGHIPSSHKGHRGWTTRAQEWVQRHAHSLHTQHKNILPWISL